MQRVAGLVLLLFLTACQREEDVAVSVMLGIPYPDSIEAEGVLLSRALITRGDSIYHGVRASGTCFTCHGDNLRGGPITPDLTDGRWNQIDGSYASIMAVVAAGVPDFDPPMPPLGGAPLSETDVQAVSAYVYWRAYRHASDPPADADPS